MAIQTQAGEFQSRIDQLRHELEQVTTALGLARSIEGLRAQFERENKSLEAAREQREQAVSETAKAKQDEKSALERVQNLGSEIASLERLAVSKTAEASVSLSAITNQHSHIKMKVDASDFTLRQLHTRIDGLQKKLDELAPIEKQHAQAVTRLSAATEHAKEIEDKNAAKDAQIESLLSEARETNQRAHEREEAAKSRQDELEQQNQATEFYRNRICAYCQEKGLPIPDFKIDG